MKRRGPGPAVLALVGANLLWAGNYLAGRALRDSINPYTLNGFRWVMSALLLWGLSRARGIRVPLWRQAPRFLLLGLTGMFLFSGLTYWGLARVGAAPAGLLAGFTPVAVLLMGRLLAGDPVRPRQWPWIVLSIAGEGVLLYSPAALGGINPTGAAALVAAALAWGVYTALGRRYRHQLTPWTLTVGAAVWGAVPAAAVGGWAWLAAGQPLALTAGSLAALLYVSTLASVVAFLLWTAGTHRLGSAVAGPFLNLLPVLTVALAVAVLGEGVEWHQLAGGALVLAGATGTTLAGWRSAPALTGTPAETPSGP
ncbi:MAG: DMT family transporter [Firmicutes bacterium]|nr:DMT family transporter [Bacillota bacterium]